MRRSFKYRAYPNKGTRRRLFNVMRRAATPVWNACIAEREQSRLLYRQKLDEACSEAVYDLRRDLTEKEEEAIRREVGKDIHWPTAYDQYKHIRKSDHGEYAPYSASMLECTVALADSSEKSFRALWLKGHKDARPPKQTNFLRVLTFRKSGWSLDVDKLTLMGIGTIPVRMHRPIEGKVKTVTIRQTRTGKWQVSFSCEIANFHGSCGPLLQPKPCVPQGLRQKHAPSGGSDPNLGGAHNPRRPWNDGPPGGSDPNLGGAHNRAMLGASRKKGGSDPNLGGAHNPSQKPPSILLGGSDPNLGGAHNEKSGRSTSRPGGSDPNLGGAHNGPWSRSLDRRGGSDPNLGGAQHVEIYFPDDGFVVDSAGFEIPHPEFYTSEIARLRRLSRSLSRKHKRSPNAEPIGSTSRGGTQPCLGRNRRRARRALAKWHERIAAKRDYFLWHVANYYARNYREVTVWTRPARPPIQYAITSQAARRLCDAAYAKFLNMLKQKCEQYETVIEIKENPKWEEEKETLTEVARIEAIQPILRKAKRAVRKNRVGHLKSLQRDCARAATVQI